MVAVPPSEATYRVLAECEISPTKQLVISAASTGGYTLAQRVTLLNDDGINVVPQSFFLRGAFHFADAETMRDLAAMLADVADEIDSGDEFYQSQ